MLLFQIHNSLLPSEKTDLLLYRIGKKDDMNALEELYESTKSAIWGLILSRVKNLHDAEDLLQEVYLCVYKNAHTYKSEGKPMAWLFTIAKNLCISNERKKSRISDTDLDSLEEYFHDNGMSDEDRLIIREIMNELTDEEQEIVILHAVSGYRHKEISEMLSLPLNTVLSKYNRAIKKLKSLMRGG